MSQDSDEEMESHYLNLNFTVLLPIMRVLTRCGVTRLSLGWEPTDTLNLQQRAFEHEVFSHSMPPLPGRATNAGHARFRRRTLGIPNHHFNTLSSAEGLSIGSVSLGSYKGDNTREDDRQLFNAIVDAALSGAVNCFDTALNFRYQRSERTISTALNYLAREKGFGRDEFILASRGGLVHEDGEKGTTAETVMREAITRAGLSADDFVEQSCLHPAFISAQLDQSLRNLGVDCIDIYGLMLPEIQLLRLHPEEVISRIGAAAELLESRVKEGRIASYGISCWSCFRVPPGHRLHLNLEDMIKAVAERAGEGHHCRYIYSPVSIALPEAFMERTQVVKGAECTLLEAASALGLNFMATSPFFSGTLFHLPLSSVVFRANYQGAKLLNFVRSLPFPALKTVVMGARNNRHLKTNLTVSHLPLMQPEDYRSLLFDSDLRKPSFENRLLDPLEAKGEQ